MGKALMMLWVAVWRESYIAKWWLGKRLLIMPFLESLRSPALIYMYWLSVWDCFSGIVVGRTEKFPGHSYYTLRGTSRWRNPHYTSSDEKHIRQVVYSVDNDESNTADDPKNVAPKNVPARKRLTYFLGYQVNRMKPALLSFRLRGADVAAVRAELQLNSVSRRKVNPVQRNFSVSVDKCPRCGRCYGEDRDPELTDDWISCDICRTWFHQSCAEDDGIIDDDEKFTCFACLQP